MVKPPLDPSTLSTATLSTAVIAVRPAAVVPPGGVEAPVDTGDQYVEPQASAALPTASEGPNAAAFFARPSPEAAAGAADPPPLPKAVPLPDRTAPSAAWRPKAGDIVFHVRYGEVEVIAVRTPPDLNVCMIEYLLRGNRLSENLDPRVFAPNQPSSPTYQHLLASHLESTPSLPELVGLSYIMRFEKRLAPYTSRYLTYPDLKIAVKLIASRRDIYAGRTVIRKNQLGLDLGVEKVRDGIRIPRLSSARDLFRTIWQEAGIDVVEEGFRYVGGTPGTLEEMIENCIYENRRNYRLLFNVSKAAIDHAQEHAGTLAKLMGIEQGPLPPGVWAVGDYDADHEAYLAMRAGDAPAIEMFAERMARRIIAEPELAAAAFLAAVPGREDFGNPIDLLTTRVAQLTGKRLAAGIWIARPRSRLESESTVSFREKRTQADAIYRLNGKDLTRAFLNELPHQDVIVIDDNFTTGATTEAVALALVSAGARRALRLVATVTRRS